MITPVYATPKHHLFISGNYRWNKLQFMVSFQRIINLNTNPESVYLQSYTLLNAKISLSYTEGFRNICKR